MAGNSDLTHCSNPRKSEQRLEKMFSVHINCSQNYDNFAVMIISKNWPQLWQRTIKV